MTTCIRIFAFVLVCVVFTFPLFMQRYNFTPQNRARGMVLGISLFGVGVALALIADYVL